MNECAAAKPSLQLFHVRNDDVEGASTCTSEPSTACAEAPSTPLIAAGTELVTVTVCSFGFASYVAVVIAPVESVTFAVTSMVVSKVWSG